MARIFRSGVSVGALDVPGAADEPSRFGVWGLRVALFAAALLVSTIAFHRMLGMATPIALSLFALVILCLVLSALLAAVSVIDIWRHGCAGAFSALVTFAICFAIIAVPATFLPSYLTLPELNDVATDVQTPPQFVKLAAARPPGSNSVQFPTGRAVRHQVPNYPDLRPIVVNRGAEEAFELAVQAVQRLGMTIVSEQPPSVEARRPGWIEAYDRTLVVGFYDDVVVRIAGDQRRSRVDLRSASRYGRHDLGRNVRRIRAFLKEYRGRLEATVPAAGARRTLRRRGARSRRIRGGRLQR